MWLSVDPLALWQPVQESEHYILGQHNGGYFNPKNMSVYGYTYQNPIVYIDPNGKQVKVTTPAGQVFNYDTLKSNYSKGIAKMEADAATTGSRNKTRWEGLIGENACAINMSYMLNKSGYIIPEFKTSSDRVTWSGGKTRGNNGNKPYQYILGATEMGDYLFDKLGEPTLQLSGANGNNIGTFIKKFDAYKNFKGIIYLRAGDRGTYGASGHVDLIYSDWGNDPYIFGAEQELDDYLEWRDGSGISNWFGLDAKLDVFIWITEYEKED